MNVITEIPFDFSQKDQTVEGLPRPNRRATVYFGTQLIYVGCRPYTSKTNLIMGPANRRRVGGGVHDSYTFQCGLVGYFTSPGIDTIQKGPTVFAVSSEIHWQAG